MEENNDEELLRRYLLGEVLEQEQDQIQDRLFTDTDFFNLLLLIENELIDDYLFKNIAPREHLQFEQYFLRSPEHRRKLRMTEELMVQASQGRPVTPPVPKRKGAWRAFFLNPRFASIAFIIILSAIIIGLLWDRQILKNKIAQFPASQEPQQKQKELPAPDGERPDEKQANKEGEEAPPPKGIQDLRPKPEQQAKDKQSIPEPEKPSPDSGGTLISKLEPQDLWSDLTRGEHKSNQVRIPPGAQQTVLKLHLETDYPSYRIEIRDSKDKRKKVIESVKTEQINQEQVLLIKVPAGIFKGGDYLISAQGIKEGGLGSITTYQFRVLIK